MNDEPAIQSFRDTVWDYYHEHGRHDLPWRQPANDGQFDAYRIVVSELMLQQTQVSRVIPKYYQFLELFPGSADLAAAKTGDVLRAWSGLGYNRRARFLHRAAQQVEAEYNGCFPEVVNELVKLPGIGKNTAGAVAAYAYNQPVVFIETNIRTVYIHHFFQDQIDIPDLAILEVVARALDREHPREWYWALMDYGSHLKQTVGNLNMLSKHYTKQAKFEGSKRQIRGQVIRLLAADPLSESQLWHMIPDTRLTEVIDALLREGLIHQQGDRYTI